SVPDSQFGDRGPALAFHHFPVWRVENGDMHQSRCIDHRLGNRLRRFGLGHVDRSSATPAQQVRAALPVFDSAVIAKYGVITPSGIARFRSEMIPVFLVTARPHHDVDARSAPQALAHAKW